jgi:hypothetical protein
MSGRPVANHAPPTSAILVAQAIAPPAVKVTRKLCAKLSTGKQLCRISDSVSESHINRASCISRGIRRFDSTDLLKSLGGSSRALRFGLVLFKALSPEATY